jgi:hypothetical protein
MRIAIAGPAGTGKTTLARLLADALGVHLIPESIRVMAEEMMIDDLNGLSKIHRAQLQAAAAAWQIAQERHHPSFVSDRSREDYEWYSSELLDTPPAYAEAGPIRLLCAGQEEYTMLFIMPPVAVAESDGFRLDRFDDSKLTSYLKECSFLTAANHHVIQSDGPVARLAECLKVLGVDQCQ